MRARTTSNTDSFISLLTFKKNFVPFWTCENWVHIKGNSLSLYDSKGIGEKDVLIKNSVITYKRKKKTHAFPFFVCVVVANIYIFAVCVFFWTSSHLWFKYSCVIYMFFLPYLTTNKGDTLDKGLFFFVTWMGLICVMPPMECESVCVFALGTKKGKWGKIYTCVLVSTTALICDTRKVTTDKKRHEKCTCARESGDKTKLA